MARHTQKTKLKDRTDRAWFSRLLQHSARKRSRSVLWTSESARGRSFYNHRLNTHISKALGSTLTSTKVKATFNSDPDSDPDPEYIRDTIRITPNSGSLTDYLKRYPSINFIHITPTPSSRSLSISIEDNCVWISAETQSSFLSHALYCITWDCYNSSHRALHVLFADCSLRDFVLFVWTNK